MKGIDVSNHNTMAYRSSLEYINSEFVIVQAINPPPGYPGHDVGGYTSDQIMAGIDDGKYVGVYVWLWNSFSTSAATKDDIDRRLALIPDVPLSMRLWLDMEDTTQDHGPARQQDVLDALEVMDAYAIDHDLPPTGVYSGDWYIRGYMDAWFPPGRVYWKADYSLSEMGAAASLSVDVPIIQYTSDPIDTNTMLESEVNVEPPLPPEGCDDLVNALAYVCDDLGDQLLEETKRPTVRKTVVRSIVKEMQRVRTEQIGPRP